MLEPANLTRRSVAAILPLAALAGPALGAPSALGAAQPSLGRRWSEALQRLRAYQNAVAPEDADDDVEGPLIEALLIAEHEIMEAPARTFDDLRLKARVIARDHDYSQGSDLAAIESMLADPECEGRYQLLLAADVLRMGR